jgi:putative acetyltransferase
VKIRGGIPADAAGIRDVVAAAFGRPNEAELVDRLCADGDMVISLVAIQDRQIAGHVLFSTIVAPFTALALAPVSVRPEHQRSGIGSGLIRAGSAVARNGGWTGVFVLGDPAYYRRFGFDPALAAGFSCRFSGPHFMALALQTPLPMTTGAIEYPRAFGRLD